MELGMQEVLGADAHENKGRGSRTGQRESSDCDGEPTPVKWMLEGNRSKQRAPDLEADQTKSRPNRRGSRSKDRPSKEPHIGQKWPGPGVSSELSRWLGLPKKTLALTQRLWQISKALQLEAVSHLHLSWPSDNFFEKVEPSRVPPGLPLCGK